MPQLHIQTYEQHTIEQKRALVRDLTKTVCDTALVQPVNVQIQFSEITRDNRAICGRLMSDVNEKELSPEEIPWLLVQFQLFQGRSLQQKREIAKGVTEDISRNFTIDPERIQIIISEMGHIHNAIGGLLALDR